MSDTDKPTLVIVGEAPGEDEDRDGKPFVGRAGKKLQAAVAQTGLLWHQIYRTNVLPCRPPRNDITTLEARLALENCKDGLEEELDELCRRFPVQLILGVGGTATTALGFRDSITACRGSVARRGATPILATYHPSYLLRGTGRGWQKEELSWLNDFEKAKSIVIHGWKEPQENFNTHPTFQEVNDFVEKHKKAGTQIAVDIEASSLDPYKAVIWMIGLGVSEEEVLVVPFYGQGRIRYWAPGVEEKIKEKIRSLFASNKVIMQNALYDARVLKQNGMPTPRIAHDVLLLHHSISPELPHNLGYIVSIYGKTPYWKELGLKHEKAIEALSDKVYRTYNARDCAVLHQVLPPMLKHLEENGTESTYSLEMKMLKPCMQLADNGIRVDQRRLKAFHKDLDRLIEERLAAMREMTPMSAHFSFTSDDNVRYLLYGIKPASYKKLEEEVENYRKNPKRSRTTKKCQATFEAFSAYYYTTPLQITKPVLPSAKTASGKLSVGKEGITSLTQNIANRVATLTNLKGALNEKYTGERNRLERLLKFIDVFISSSTSYRKLGKLRTTYTKFPIGPDGRVHGSYLIHGTATGRLSSRSPNMQNLPKAAKTVFVAEEGCSFVSADYSNIELRVLAYVTGDDVLVAMFNAGQNVHSENCRLLFGIDEQNPLWDAARRASKTYIFGRVYGGSLQGIYKKIVAAVPTLGLTLEAFKRIDGTYRAAHPKYAEWYDKTVAGVAESGVVSNAFGRKRYLLGDLDSNARKALNTPIQGTAADIANQALIELADVLPAEARLVSAIHDSVTVECPHELVTTVQRIMRECMERPYVINGYDAKFPVEFEVTQYLGDSHDFSYEDEDEVE